jgi:mRNA-degrading endonuclease toxin of MazEF toxin-antitoxin module
LVVPATSKLKTGAWYHDVIIGNTKSSLNFAQIRNIDAKRLIDRIEELPSNTQASIYQSFRVFSQNKKYAPTCVGERGYSRKSSAHERTDPL